MSLKTALARQAGLAKEDAGAVCRDIFEKQIAQPDCSSPEREEWFLWQLLQNKTRSQSQSRAPQQGEPRWGCVVAVTTGHLLAIRALRAWANAVPPFLVRGLPRVLWGAWKSPRPVGQYAAGATLYKQETYLQPKLLGEERRRTGKKSMEKRRS